MADASAHSSVRQQSNPAARLVELADRVDADLIVMASHIPGLADYVFSSNAGYLASHSKLSVFVVR